MTRVSAARSADVLKARGCCEREIGVHCCCHNATALRDPIRSELCVWTERSVCVVLIARGMGVMGPRSRDAVRDNIVGNWRCDEVRNSRTLSGGASGD